MLYHLTAFIIGIVLDLIFGDPYMLPHPVRWIGSLICTLEKRMNNYESNGAEKNLIFRGLVMVMIVILTVMCAAVFVLGMAYYVNPFLGTGVEAILTYQILAMKSLRKESMKVYYALDRDDVEGARRAVSMIVGRDTKPLSDVGIAKAAIETVAENTSDGVIAPMIYTALGGPVAGLIYKAINTMDSMVGYRNERYLFFGRCAAGLDDIVNFIPARISAYLMIFACVFMGKDYSTKGAYRIHKRDSKNHASPNSAQTESVCAGALMIQLAGDAYYFGKLHSKPFIGDALRPVEYEDIRRANNLMYMTSFICALICVLIMMIFVF